jgi:hypothetical protein
MSSLFSKFVLIPIAFVALSANAQQSTSPSPAKSTNRPVPSANASGGNAYPTLSLTGGVGASSAQGYTNDGSARKKPLFRAHRKAAATADAASNPYEYNGWESGDRYQSNTSSPYNKNNPE